MLGGAHSWKLSSTVVVILSFTPTVLQGPTRTLERVRTLWSELTK
jgi:hypothetical protein